MTKQLTVVFQAVGADGHVNACIGLAEYFRDRKHTIIFVTSEAYRERLTSYGFIVELFKGKNQENNSQTAEHFAEIILSTGALSANSSIAKLELREKGGLSSHILNESLLVEPILKSCVERYKPDVIIVDSFIVSPSIILSGIPWIKLWSPNPLLAFNDERLPPPRSGYAANGNPEEWRDFREKLNKMYAIRNTPVNDWYAEHSLPPLNQFYLESPYLNIYCCPQELDYTDIIDAPPNWYRVDNFMRSENGSFEIPQQLRNKSGKLIYFSMGSVATLNVDMMVRLVSILSKSEHRFIVSKGRLHFKYNLADNMWGEKSVPQTLVLPLVDLFITHGGNNSVTEAFYFGKPMIVMPLFGDQYDNAQRIHEKGFGIRLDPHLCTDQELLSAINQLLFDDSLNAKLISISNQIQSNRSLDKAIDVIEKLVI